jgi:hypothetical protein
MDTLERKDKTIVTILHRIRQNHALEHATMHILSQCNPYVQLMGRSTSGGFYIYGDLDTRQVANAASEALVRLQQGEEHLAVHPRCGTNLAVTAVLAGTAAFAATLGRSRSKLDRLPLALTAATIGAIVAQPLGHRIQERITTTPAVFGLHIVDVQRREQGRFISHKVVIGQE